MSPPTFKILASTVPEKTMTNTFNIDKIERERGKKKWIKWNNMSNEPKSQSHDTITHFPCEIKFEDSNLHRSETRYTNLLWKDRNMTKKINKREE